MRDIDRITMNSTREKYRWRSIKARMSSLENYWQRNLVMIERGTHPKMKIRADAKKRAAGNSSQTTAADRLAAQREVRAREAEREGAMREIYNDYVSARKKCGQDANIDYRQVRAALQSQARNIQTKESCKDVKFKVKVKGGKASITAIPIR